MIKKGFSERREVKEVNFHCDLVVVGGGLAGVCCALTAAREGISVVLFQDRPVLGGNSSSEVRLWILGATSHMGNNNRWAREGGVVDEILVENMYRNRQGNPVIFDTVLLEKVLEEDNITLLLNTPVYDIAKNSDQSIDTVIGYCSQNSTRYLAKAPLFCDASGDGIVAFMAGASFRMGAESPSEFDEPFAPNVEDYGELLGHSLYFHTKDAGEPIDFVAPSYALKDVDKLTRWQSYQLKDDGCRLWWVEYGGRLDTVHQTEEIKWELWKVVYGIWDHVKNSGEFPEAKNLTLEWVGTIPGKRESRRFVGDYMLMQKDIIEQREHYDAVSFGGWSIDLHPADGVFSDMRPCNQWHSKGIYEVPYRCFYSKDIDNLFLAGRIISASHVAFASTRVMATTAHGGQAVGMAAVLATQNNFLPRRLSEPDQISNLQQALNRLGQGIPRISSSTEDNLMRTAKLTASSQSILSELPFDGPWVSLQQGTAQLLPLQGGQLYSIEVELRADQKTNVQIELRTSSKSKNYTPDVILDTKHFDLEEGVQRVQLDFKTPLQEEQYGFVTFLANEFVSVRSSTKLISGIVSVFNKFNKAVSNYGKQEPPEGLGIEAFEFWTPRRRPDGKNLAMTITPPLDAFQIENIQNGFVRPSHTTNAFVADLADRECTIDIRWPDVKRVSEVILFFDTDYDHPMESTLLGHLEDKMPFCVEKYSLQNKGETILAEVEDNHQTINTLKFKEPIETDHLQLILHQTRPNVPISIFEIMCFA